MPLHPGPVVPIHQLFYERGGAGHLGDENGHDVRGKGIVLVEHGTEVGYHGFELFLGRFPVPAFIQLPEKLDLELSPLADSLIMEVGLSIGWFMDSTFFLVIVGATLIYERPIRKVLRGALRTKESLDPDLMNTAQQLLLNEPYYLIAKDFLLGNT